MPFLTLPIAFFGNRTTDLVFTKSAHHNTRTQLLLHYIIYTLYMYTLEIHIADVVMIINIIRSSSLNLLFLC